MLPLRPRNNARRAGVWLAALLLLLGGCTMHVLKPLGSYENYQIPPAPDYSRPESWAALPTRLDSADAVPRGSGLHDAQAMARADVFFLHLTTRIVPQGWNADIGNALVNRFTDEYSIRNQASVFNAAARVYAPRYRQAVLYSFFDSTANSQQALEVAYTDVRAAFSYYLQHYNQGRPIIIAGHSQGTYHAQRLLREFFDADPILRKRLVAAYLVGLKVGPSAFRTLRPCRDSLQTGCYVSWNTAEWGHDYAPYTDAAVVNPLSWTRDTAAVPAARNPGSVPMSFGRIDRQLADAKIHRGLLWVHPTGEPISYVRFLLPGQGELRHSFHLVDYGLYYLSIRRNAVARVQAWFRTQAKPAPVPAKRRPK